MAQLAHNIAAGLAALGGAAADAAAAEKKEPRSEDTQLQKAIQLSLLNCGHGRGDSGGGTSAAAGAATVGGQQRRLRHQRHQQQCSGPDPVLLHALLEAVEDPGGSPVAAHISGGAAAGVTRQGLLVPAHESDLLLPAPALAPAASPAAAAVSEAAISAAAAAHDSEFTETIDLSSQPTINGDAEAPLAVHAAAVAPAAAAAAYVHAEVVEDEPLLCTEGINPKGAAGAAGAAVRATAAAAQYRLHGVVSHEGPAASCGHFTSDVLDAASLTWPRLNDSQARRISAAEARSSSRQRECHLLFYVAAPAGVVYATQRTRGGD
ncbi:hypothetical protein ACK3TF_001838 [Chlorella vulgaris]